MHSTAPQPDPAPLRDDLRALARPMLLITLLGAVLRLFRFWEPALWVDEIETLAMCAPDGQLSFGEQFLDDIQCPLYLASVWPLVRIQVSEILLRLPAVIAGILAIPAFGLLARRLVDRHTAVWAMLLLAINPFHIWHSQDARGYAYIVLFTILSTLYFLRCLEGRFALKYLGMYLAATTAMVLSNMSGLFLLGGQMVAALWIARPGDRRNRWALLAAGLLVLLIVSPWLHKAGQILAVERLVPGNEAGDPLRSGASSLPAAVLHAVFATFFGYSLGPSLHELVRPDRMEAVREAWPLLVAAALLVGEMLRIGLRRIGRRTLLMFAVWIVLPMLAITILAQRNVKTFNPRYLASTLPFFLLLASIGLARWRTWRQRAGSLLLIALTLVSVGGALFSERYAKGDIRAAARHVATLGTVEEPVIIPRVKRVFDHYYDGPAATLELDHFMILGSLDQARDVMRVRAGGAPSCWVVLCRTWAQDPRNYLETLIEGEGEILDDRRYPGVRLVRWAPPG